MTVELFQGGALNSVGWPTLLNAGLLLVNAGIAIGSWKAHQNQREKTQKEIRGRLGELEDEGSAVTQEQIDQLRREVDRLNDYITPLIQERLREGQVVRFERDRDADGRD